MLHEYPTLFVSWRSPKSRLIHPVGRLTTDASKHDYEFRYIGAVQKARADGFLPFPEFPSFEGTYRSTNLFPLFANRLMPASRPGYATFLRSLGLSPESANPMLILARSGGRETDQIELIPCPAADASPPGCYSTSFLLRAIRYMPQPAAEERIAKLCRDEQLFPMPDSQNPVDSKAIAVRTNDNVMIGYLPAYLTTDMRVLQNECEQLKIFVERVNLPPVEVHHRLLCRIVSCWPNGFRPFDTPDFQPL